MEKVFVNDKDIVIPGEPLAEGFDFLPAGKAFREDEKIFASTIGLVYVKGRVIKVIPLAGKYMPKRGDIVIGKVTNIGHSGWTLDIDCPYLADLNIGEASSEYIDLRKASMNQFFDIGDYALTEVTAISEGMFVKLTAKYRPYRRLVGGTIIKVSPTKIPRIIGKAGSMIKMLKDHSNCDITVGQNGLIWIKGDAEKQALVSRIIKVIEKESHLPGLTDKIKVMLESGK